MEKYRRTLPLDDWPFWYGERPLVGFVVAAITSLGGVCLEEYRQDKRPRKKESPSGKRLGRGDLYYFMTSNRHGNIEFKKHDVPIRKPERFCGLLRDWWQETKDDARRAKIRDAPKLGGLFLRPYIAKGRDADAQLEHTRNVKKLLTKTWEAIQPDAMAWWCPISKVIESDENVTKSLVVGAIMVIKKVSSPSR